MNRYKFSSNNISSERSISAKRNSDLEKRGKSLKKKLKDNDQTFLKIIKQAEDGKLASIELGERITGAKNIDKDILSYLQELGVKVIIMRDEDDYNEEYDIDEEGD